MHTMFQKKYRELVDAEKYQEAIALAETRLCFDKTVRKWWREWKAFCLIRLWRHEEAAAIYKRRLDFDPNDPNALFPLSTTYLRYIKDYSLALKYINKCLRILEKNKEKFLGHYLIKGNILRELWEYDLAIKFYLKEINKSHKWDNIQYVLKCIEECRDLLI